MKHTAIYCRVSSADQSTESQQIELRRWVTAYASDDEECVWYTDTSNDHVSMDREAWNRLQAECQAGNVSRIVIYSLDRLGRKASKLLNLFDELDRLNIGLVSIREAVDFTTAMGRMVRTVFVSLAEYDNEQRSARIRLGKARRKASGLKQKSRKGIRTKITDETIQTMRQMLELGHSLKTISEAVGLSYSYTRRVVAGELKGLMPPRTAKTPIRSKVTHRKVSTEDIRVILEKLKTSDKPRSTIAAEHNISRQYLYEISNMYGEKSS